jgi:hypothetical protein
MKNSIDINEFTFDPLNPDFDLKEELINELVKISKRVKYSEISVKKNDNHLDKPFVQTIKDIAKFSMDITYNYTCAPIIGLSIAGKYGENARESFHKICKINEKYNFDWCDNMYSNCLKNNSETILIKPFYLLTVYSLYEKMDTLINEKSKEKKHKSV